jgi:hypothetical protein
MTLKADYVKAARSERQSFVKACGHSGKPPTIKLIADRPADAA